MEKAILKTLIYADIFDYPLKINEIHKWLIGRKVTLRQIEAAVKRLTKKSKVKSQKGFYFLPRRDALIGKRLQRQAQSEKYFKKAEVLTQVLKTVPWIKLVGVSGGLALNNASKKDDIDLFIITCKNRLWISRLFILGLLSLIGQRRKREDKQVKAAGKLCVNILLEEDNLGQKYKDIYIAHEILQMKVLWQRDGIYSKYLSDNSWAFEFLPNWIINTRFKIKNHKSSIINHESIFGYIEYLANKLQLWYMKTPEGLERIEKGALYFHPEDCRTDILEKYKKKISRINIGTP